jgi:hypothetical protein
MRDSERIHRDGVRERLRGTGPVHAIEVLPGGDERALCAATQARQFARHGSGLEVTCTACLARLGASEPVRSRAYGE